MSKLAANPSGTLIDFLAARMAAGTEPAIRHKQDGAWVSLTWQDVGQRACQRARALQRLGVAPGERVVQVAENSLDWLLTDLAILLAGGVHVPIHPTLSGAQIAEQIADCGAKLVFVSGEHQLAKLSADAGANNALPPDVQLLSYGLNAASAGAALPEIAAQDIAQAEAPHQCAAADVTALVRLAQQQASPETLATILYTSGTTGEPKGVMLSHGNLVSNVESCLEVLCHEPGDIRLGWLPLSHVFARTCDWYTTLGHAGVELVLAESRETILADCAAVRPTLINGVPYFFEKVARGVQEQGAPASVLPQILGGRLRLCMSGGAALPEHVAKFFNEGGINLKQGYGLTETSPVITINPDTRLPASVGPAIPGVEVRIADDGEIQTRGPLVMQGYWQKPQATAEAMDGEWFRTGDLGRLDENGFLFITGRKKEILVTAAGKNVAPVFVETLLTADPLIVQAMVVGDGRKFLSALLVVDSAALAAEVQQQPSAVDVNSPEVNALLEQRIRLRLQPAGEHEQVRCFRVIDRPFSIESGELTPTLKLRRGEIARNFADVIEAMYAGPDDDRCD